MPRKTKTADKAEESNVIELYKNQNTELAFLDEIEIGDDGLDTVESNEIRLPSFTWNMKMKGPDGRPMLADVFYDTLNETTSEELRLVLLLRVKQNQWSFYDNASEKTVTVCRSQDRKTGHLQVVHDQYGPAGTERNCKGCPESNWREDKDGKRVLDCATVHNIFAFDVNSGRPCVIRFRRSSEKPFLTHLQRHHIGAHRMPNGKRINVPLYAYEVSVKLEMSDNGMYAFPVFERGRVLSKAEFEQMMQVSRDLREFHEEALQDTEERENAVADREEHMDDEDAFVDAQAS